MSWHDESFLKRSRVAFDARQIDDAIGQVAAGVTDRLAHADPVLIPVLLGGLPFAAELLRRLHFDLQVDYAQMSRYRGGREGGSLHWVCQPRMPLAGRVVLLVDDVLDDGETLAELRRWCLEDARAAAVYGAVLVRKSSPRRPAGMDADFVGLDAGPEFLFGFGMDVEERYRHLPEIRVVPKENG